MAGVWMPEMGNFTLWNAVLLAIVLTVGLVCVGCIWHALQNLKIEKSVYDALQKEDKLQVLYERYRRGEVKGPDALIVPDFYSAVVEQARQYDIQDLDSSAAVLKYLKVLYGGAIAKKLQSGYVSDRLYAVLCSVDTDNMVKKLPALEDLRELTMQRERGGLSTSAFRLLAPSILVCGILGTLVGVHSCLVGGERGNEIITVLADALLPGALAVGITVVVMSIRGIYNSRWAHFVSGFDEYTLRQLLPLFRPSTSQVETDIDQLGVALSETREQYEHIQGLRRKIRHFQKKVEKCHRLCAALLGASRSRLDADCGDYEMRYKQSLQLQEVQKKLVNALDMLQSRYKSLLQRVQLVQKRVLSPHAKHSLLRVFEQLIPPAQASIRRLYSIDLECELESLRQLVEEASKTIATTPLEDAQREEYRMKSAAEWFAHLEARCQQFEAAGQMITEIDNQIDEEIVHHLNPSISSELPALIDALNQNYDAARAVSETHRDRLVRFNKEQAKEITDKKRMMSLKVDSMLRQTGEKTSYPAGWSGFKLRVRDWRLAERDKWLQSKTIGWRTWTFIIAGVGVFVVWPAWWVCLLCGLI
ncbi:MAG: hypothetical protein II349_00015 [Akkermansia sp.]|nr:hypothetical protein [Akkermansia sp.]